RRSAHRMVRREAWMVAGAAPVLAGPDHSSISRPLPLHVLLLSGRVLQGVLGRSAELRGWRATEELHRRAFVSADSAERPPVFHVHRGAVSIFPVARRLEGALVRRRRGKAFRNR